MENEKEIPEFQPEDILNQFEEPAAEETVLENTAELDAILGTLEPAPVQAEDMPLFDLDAAPVFGDVDSDAAFEMDTMDDTIVNVFSQAQSLFSDAAGELPTASMEDTGVLPVPEEEASAAPTRRLDELNFSKSAGETEEPTTRVPTAEAAAAAASKVADSTGPIPLSRSAKLRELKKKLVAGPEKRYYTLSEQGVVKLQIGMLCNFIILIMCAVVIFLYTKEMIPAHRIRVVVFSQVLAMLVSGLLGSNLLIDGIGDLFHLRYSLNTTLAISFLACGADAWFCLAEERVPCCGAFVLHMTVAMLARYHKRTTEMAQLDTMRKAVNLTSLVKEPQYYDKRAGILRGQGDVEDFMETYSRPSGPEILQQLFSFVALICCIGIAVLAGLLHGVSMGVQIFATSLMVSVPASYFIALTRPAALLEKRLHMVGAVICGWQGVKKLCGRAVIPLRDKDLFPRGSTKLNGIKFYSDYTPTEVVSYTASLIFEAGGGLVPLFRNLLVSRSGTEYEVVNFRDYGSGGIGGEVNGEPILLGSLEFLQDMGVEIPQGTMVSQAVYVSIDGQLAAVIAISYGKMRSAAAGIVSLCGCRKLRTLLLAGDFMLTDNFIRSKFNIRTRRLILPPKEVRAELAAKKADPEADVLALVTRDDLISSAYAITGAMALRTSCRLGSFIHLIAGIAGIVIMLALAYLGSTELLTPAHVMLYELVWFIPGLLATEWTRTV